MTPDHAESADVLCTTASERRCLAELRDLTGQADGPMERHSLRVITLTRMLADRAGLQVDEELVTCAGLLHDLGLYPGAATSAAYVTDSRRLAERLLGEEGWEPERIARCAAAVELHHELRSQWARGAECELLRRADLIEVSHGLFRFGIARSELRSLVARVPRAGFVGEVTRGLLRAARERPRTLWRITRPR